MGDDVTRDPAWEALFDEARKLAREDAKADRDPQVLIGHLAPFQTEYDAAFTEAQLEPTSN